MKLISTSFKSVSLIFALFILTISCGTPKEDGYKQALNVVSDSEIYHKLIDENPTNELIDLEKFIPDIIFDIRYATKNNFTKQVIYNSPKAFVRKPVADALAKIQTELKAQGLGLKIFDAYRPYAATVKFYEVYPDTNFVAAPWKGSVHNRGCAVDLTIVNTATNMELKMPTPFDDFTDKAAHSYIELSDTVLKNRTLLREIMEKHGFQIYSYEWWHYNFNGWQDFQLMDIPFEQLVK